LFYQPERSRENYNGFNAIRIFGKKDEGPKSKAKKWKLP